jgi:hypothetical protein
MLDKDLRHAGWSRGSGLSHIAWVSADTSCRRDIGKQVRKISGNTSHRQKCPDHLSGLAAVTQTHCKCLWRNGFKKKATPPSDFCVWRCSQNPDSPGKARQGPRAPRINPTGTVHCAHLVDQVLRQSQGGHLLCTRASLGPSRSESRRGQILAYLRKLAGETEPVGAKDDGATRFITPIRACREPYRSHWSLL